jgi:thiol-disulfide isomerase/thioredoxin
MKKYYYLIFLTFILACSTNTNNSFKIPKKIIISGRIYNSDSLNKEILFSVICPGRSNENIRAKVDSLGNFSTSFKSYTPTDIWVEHKTGFYMLVHPGDSLHITFNGDLNDTPELLKSIKYSGDAANINQDVANFQQLYYSNTLLHNRNADKIAVKELNAQEYLKYINTIRLEARMMFKTFKDELTSEKEAILWASTFIEKDYYFALAAYPDYHRYLNNISMKDWEVPTSYYDSLLNLLPINKSMLICGNAISGLINTFHYNYARIHVFQDPEYKKVVSKQINSPNLQEIKDSLLIQGLIKYTPDSLTKQLVLTEMIQQDFDINEICFFEKNRKILETYIREPFLINPIIERYNIIKERLAKPEIFSDKIFKTAKKSSVNHIIDSIITLNKRKVIYINFWATWCAPCLGEFPEIKTLMKQMENKDVSFVFICLDSKEKIWKEKYDELNIGEQHYFLSKEQSNDMHEIFEFNGVPYHVLIDKEGAITKKGNHLTQSVAKEEIGKLLE